MSIYNMIASIVGGGGGEVVVEQPSEVTRSDYSGMTDGQVQFQVTEEPFCVMYLSESNAIVLYDNETQLYCNATSGGTTTTLHYSYDDSTNTVTMQQSLFPFAKWTTRYYYIYGTSSGGGGGSANLQAKTHIGASTSSQTITADTGYDGLSSVQIDPVSQTNLLAGNIKSGTTVSISNGTSNLWSVTGTYSGGSSKNVQTNQTTSRTSSTTLTSVNSLTCTTAGTYDVYWTCDRSSTSGTWSSRLYLGGTAYGSEQTTWSNHVQTVHLSNVSISANQTVAVYVKARGTNYYGYAPQLTIVQS